MRINVRDFDGYSDYVDDFEHYAKDEFKHEAESRLEDVAESLFGANFYLMLYPSETKKGTARVFRFDYKDADKSMAKDENYSYCYSYEY